MLLLVFVRDGAPPAEDAALSRDAGVAVFPAAHADISAPLPDLHLSGALPGCGAPHPLHQVTALTDIFQFNFEYVSNSTIK